MAIQYSDKNGDMVSTLPEPYNITGSNDQFSIAVDGGSNQVITLTHGATRTAAQIVTDLAGLTSATASVCTINGVNFVRVRTTSALGATSTLLVNAPANNSNTILGFTATTYTGGANVASVFTGDTKQHIINGIETALLAAGWITISGSTTTNLLMQSSMTPNPQNLRMRIRVKDNGNTCVVCSIENSSGTKTGTNGTSNGGQLLPQAGKGFKVFANKYQAFITVPGSIQARDFVAFGTVYLPTQLQGLVWEAAWLHGNSISDTDTSTQRNTFRICLVTEANLTNVALQQNLCNGNLWENPNNTAAKGMQGLFAMLPAGVVSSSAQNNTHAWRWHDGSSLIVDPLIAWGLTADTDEGFIRGQLWDAFVSSDAFPADTPISSVDSHNWVCITANNQGSTSPLYCRGSLLVVTP